MADLTGGMFDATIVAAVNLHGHYTVTHRTVKSAVAGAAQASRMDRLACRSAIDLGLAIASERAS
jgi:hypothetical protein